MNIFYCCTEFI